MEITLANKKYELTNGCLFYVEDGKKVEHSELVGIILYLNETLNEVLE